MDRQNLQLEELHVPKAVRLATAGYSGDGGPATAALLDEPEGLALTAAGDILIADFQPGVIRSFTPPTGGEGTTVSIAPAPLVITAVSRTMIAGGPVPSLTASFAGLVNGDTAASLRTPPALATPATSASPIGNYRILVGGASSPNYRITFVDDTITVIPLPKPAVVQRVSIQKIKTGKHKTAQVIVVRFSEALDAADAQNFSSYILATVAKSKKQNSKPVALAKASYSSATFTLTTRKALVLSPPLELTIEAASLLDAPVAPWTLARMSWRLSARAGPRSRGRYACPVERSVGPRGRCRDRARGHDRLEASGPLRAFETCVFRRRSSPVPFACPHLNWHPTRGAISWSLRGDIELG